MEKLITGILNKFSDKLNNMKERQMNAEKLFINLIPDNKIK